MSTASSPRGPGGPSLRLFEPVEPSADDSGAPCPAWSLGLFFARYALPVVGKSCKWSKSTISEYQNAVDYWVALTGDPPIGQITAYHAAEFVDGLRVQDGGRKGLRLQDDGTEYLSTATVRKHCATIRRLFGIAGPPEQRSGDDLRRFGAGLSTSLPWIQSPDPDDEFPMGDFTLDEVLVILAACAKMTSPRKKAAPGPIWWKALVLFLVGTGLRIGATMQLEWRHIDRQRLLVPGAISKKRKKHIQYLHPEVLKVIEPLRGKSRFVFGVETWHKPGTQRWIQYLRRRLVAYAALPKERRFGFHGFRRFHGTDLWTIDELAARDSLNHDDVETTRRSYANGEVQIETRVSRQQAAIDRMPIWERLT